jgi:superfamily II DNA helicase RecQ
MGVSGGRVDTQLVGFGSDTAPATRIQSEVWARALCASPPDLVAISATGSGKTLAFLMPARTPPQLPPAARGLTLLARSPLVG